jgi:alkanesulfonate monooxygenase SsuD/methylene tetrahydromethanopterin reductase-like flavin-dependent oxidoreductase (luciferase family)
MDLLLRDGLLVDGSGAAARPADVAVVAARLQEYVDAGVRHFIISPATPEDTLEVVVLAAEDVQPRLRLPRAVTGLNACQTDGDAQPLRSE